MRDRETFPGSPAGEAIASGSPAGEIGDFGRPAEEAMDFGRELADFRGMGGGQLRDELERRLGQAEPADEDFRRKADLRWADIAKPLGSLGILEAQISAVAAMRRALLPSLGRRALVIFCADNGVVEEGVSQTGQGVTSAVAGNISRGTSCSSLMAARCDARVYPVDLGIAEDIKDPGMVHPLVNRAVRRGTRNFLREDAMTEEECLRAVLTGIDAARVLAESGVEIIAGGEMGIGNTTTASAMTSVLLGAAPEDVTGRGAGLSDRGLSAKIRAVREGIAARKPDPSRPLEVLQKLGGYDIAGMAGLFLGGAISRIPVVMDGFISQCAALCAVRILPAAGGYLLASHASGEPGSRSILRELRKEAPIHAGLHLGEGTGALLLLPALDMALAVYRDMLSFEEIGVTAYQPY